MGKGVGLGLKLQKKCTTAVSGRVGRQGRKKRAGKGTKPTGKTCYSAKHWELCSQQQKKGKQMFLLILI